MYRCIHQLSYDHFADVRKFRQKFYAVPNSNASVEWSERKKHEKDVYVKGRIKLTTLFLPLAISCAISVLGFFFGGWSWQFSLFLAWILTPLITVIYVFLMPQSKLKNPDKDITQ